MLASRRLFIGLGSNIGDRRNYLSRAIMRLQEEIGPIMKRSAIYETAAWGKKDQSDFLNQVVILKSNLTVHQILQLALRLEMKMGRTRLAKWDERKIDIDLLFYQDLIVKSDKLTLPHPFISERKFILAPLAEIAPNFIHPVLKKTMLDLLNSCSDSLAVTRIKA